MNTKKAQLSNAGGATAGDCELAQQMLDCLRHRTGEFGLGADFGEQGAAIGGEPHARIFLPADKAAYAVALGYCLAPHFPTLKALGATKAFVVIRCRVGDDAAMVGDVLADAVVCEVGDLAYNPHHRLGNEDRFVVIGDASARHLNGSIHAIAQAAERCLPIFCILAVDDQTPDVFAGADLELQLPPMTPEMLSVLFQSAHEQVPADVLAFTSAEKLRAQNLVAHIRRGRPAVECLAGLQHLVAPMKSTPDTGTARLADLAGYGEAKTWGLELSQDMEAWRAGKLNWDEIDHRAVILAGPPGTGKTSFAGVLAGAMEVPLIGSSVAEWNSHQNLSGTLKRMKEMFKEAISKTPCVLLIDEIDGISSRTAISGDHVEYWTQIINLMLVLVSEALSTPGVVIVGATNHVQRIDPALMRSGRLDRTIHIEPPNKDAIVTILAHYVGPGLYAGALTGFASRLAGQTGADIQQLVRTAKASARRAGRPFSLADIEAQIPDPSAKLPPRTRRRIAVYRNAQRIVAQVLGLAEMASSSEDLVRQMARSLTEERFHTEQTCNDVLAVILAGRAGEEIVFGDVSTFGAAVPGSDLAVATAIARDIEFKTGFGECGLIYLDGPEHRQALSSTAAASVRRRIDAALARASAVLLENAEELGRPDSRGLVSTAAPNIRLLH